LAGEYDFWYISNIAFAIGVLFALYEPYVKIAMDKVGILLAIIFGAGSYWVVYKTLYTIPTWTTPQEVIRSSIIAVTIFTMFVASLAAVWKWYDPVIPVLGSYSLYFYLTHTFLFMWAVNNIDEDMKRRIFIAAGLIAVVSTVMGIVMDILLKPLQNLLKKKA
jgi:peptidoglycan/LPS O-acetylase OafA/YrhL